MNATLLRPLLNRGFELPKDDWYQLAPFGEFPVMAERADGTKVRLVQVLDSKACAAITNRFNAVAMNPAFPGMLIDKDHFSQEAELPSEAMGWIFELANRDGQNGDGGLWARIRWSDVGAAAVKGGSYRFISPCFDPNTVENLGNARIRPLYLDTAGLTNAPNIRGSKPLSNRRGDAANPNPNNEGKPNMDLIRKALGLAVDADEAACVAAITPLKNRITPEALASGYVAKPEHEKIVTANTTLTNRNTELLGELVDRDLEVHAAIITDKPGMRTQLLANREGTLAILKGIKPAAPAPLTNRGSAKNPADKGGDNKGADLPAKQRSVVEEYRLKNRCSFNQAWDACRRADPETFRNPEESNDA